ncbi:hypothetical protein WN55_01346 [Dufourea novaeangliae]|uniref:Uncharacterized protein n=1 Tax=Dufourea novaeangliae TaxID=178035 RepID=A0A154PGB1_DUFNO|nr:hypothetical protein WN55_01346 [Dufourea novaeangliae]
MRHHRTNQIVGPDTVLRSFDLRAGRRQLWPSVRTCGGLRTAAEGQPEMQALREDQQDRSVPRLLPDFRLRGRSKARVPGHPDPATAHGDRGDRKVTGSRTHEGLKAPSYTMWPLETQKQSTK